MPPSQFPEETSNGKPKRQEEDQVQAVQEHEVLTMPESTKYKTVGDSAPVGQESVSSPSSLASRPNVSVLIGDTVPLQRTPMSSPSSIERKGTYCLIGDSVAISQEPNKVVGNSAMLPTSNEAKRQSDVPKVSPSEVRK